jgi:hypothetical protein
MDWSGQIKLKWYTYISTRGNKISVLIRVIISNHYAPFLIVGVSFMIHPQDFLTTGMGCDP